MTFGPKFREALIATGFAHKLILHKAPDITIGEELTAAEEKALAALLKDYDPKADPEPTAPPRRFSKRALFASLTDQEYATWEMIEGQQSPRRRRMLVEAVELNEADQDFDDLYAAMKQAYGQGRADEILAAATLA